MYIQAWDEFAKAEEQLYSSNPDKVVGCMRECVTCRAGVPGI